VDDDGNILPNGTKGNIAVHKSDPVAFLGYLNDIEATSKKFAGDWLVTGDLGYCEESGYFRFIGRSDDIIKSAGYRIGPAEVEDCIMKHPSVGMCAVIGVPDATRGEAVKAFIITRKDHTPNDDLKKDIQEFVKRRLAAYEYPRQIEFVTSLPMTTTGKIQRRILRDQEIQKLQKQENL